jgi:NACalpha-BTF3-like transcription factor
MINVTLKDNEVKVLKQLTSLNYSTALPAVDMDFVAQETNLSFEQVVEALKGLHYNPANILKTMHHNQPHWIYVEISSWTSEVARSFK